MKVISLCVNKWTESRLFKCFEELGVCSTSIAIASMGLRWWTYLVSDNIDGNYNKGEIFIANISKESQMAKGYTLQPPWTTYPWDKKKYW